MRLKKIIGILEADHLVDCGEREVEAACGCDLMSDVLAFVEPGALLLTGLTNSQIVRAADMADIAAVCLVRARKPQADAIELAGSLEVPIIVSGLCMYEACGRLYRAGLPSSCRCGVG